MATFIEAEGFVHVTNVTNGEFTMCGDAFDLASDIDGYEQKSTKKTTVTCEHCVAIVRDLQGVRTRL